MIFPSVHYAFAEFRGGAPIRPPSKYAPGQFVKRNWQFLHQLATILGPAINVYNISILAYQIKLFFMFALAFIT